MRKIVIPSVIALLLILIIAVSSFSGPHATRQADREALLKEAGTFFNVLLWVKSDYVDEVPTKKLLEGAMNGLLRSLDSYSQFLNAEAYEDLKRDTQGEYLGIGIEISVKGGVLHVIAPLDGTPAEQAGIKAGDNIIKIDDLSTRDITLAEAVKRMKGAEDFETALKGLESGQMSGLIVDVRNNAGGLLNSAVEVTEKFIPQGKVVVSTRGRNPKRTTSFLSHTKHPHKGYPLVILVDKGSASGSEILAGAVQDYHLGAIVGVKTFGKGSVQSLIPLGDGTAIRMTTSRYLTPAGRLIHEVGVTPDVVVEAQGDKSVKDNQLERALALVNELKAKPLAA